MGQVVARPLTWLAAIALLAASSWTASAQTGAANEPSTPPASNQAQADPARAPDPDAWRLTTTLYAWAMSVTGNATARGQTIDTNASFIDLLQKSDSLVGFMGYFEADKGRVGFYTDLVFAKLGFAAGQTNYRNPIAGLRITTTAAAALTMQMFIVEMGGVYELYRWGESQGSFTAIDALGGFRYWNLSADATFDATINADFSRLHIERTAGIAIAHSGVLQWVDPLVGFRVRHQFTPNQQVFVRGDVGGFGLGSSFTWQAVAAYSYAWQFTGYQIAAMLGFRALGVNYSTSGGIDAAGLNEVLYGPIIGVSFRF